MFTTENNNPMESYPMNGGDGHLSYTENSSLQVVDTAKNLIAQVIEDNLDIESPIFKSSDKFRIADLGCSVGPNTYFAVKSIIDAVEHKDKSNQNNSSTPEFQVYFNDHVGNDFNTLFRNIPQPSPYFAAGVPGSFHGRLFPKSTLHILHSSIVALHWLSKIPKEVVDRTSPAWNKGRIYCSGIEEKVAEAFGAQHEKDIDTFLNARAEEIVQGGLMVLQIGGTREGVTQSRYLIGKVYDILESCLEDMVKKGLISEEQVDSFNLPLHFPSTKEMETIILKNGDFSIERLDVLTYSRFQILKNIQTWSQHIRAGIEGVVRNHFGNDIMEELEENHPAFLENPDNDGVTLFIVLKRNSTEFVEVDDFLFLKK